MAKATMSISKRLFALKDTEKGQTDLRIICGDEIHNVHKIVMCASSPFFEKACQGSFKESNQGIIQLPDDEPKAVTAMIRFIYLDEYLVDCGTPKCRRRECTCLTTLSLHVEVYNLAEKYGIPELKTTSCTGLSTTISKNPICVTGEEFLKASKAVYTGTPETDSGMRSVVADVIASRAALIANKKMTEIAQ